LEKKEFNGRDISLREKKESSIKGVGGKEKIVTRRDGSLRMRVKMVGSLLRGGGKAEWERAFVANEAGLKNPDKDHNQKAREKNEPRHLVGEKEKIRDIQKIYKKRASNRLEGSLSARERHRKIILNERK